MGMTVSYKQMRSSKRLLDYAREHMQQKLEKQVGGPINIHLRFSEEKGLKNVCANAVSQDGFQLTAKHSAELLFEAIDRTTEKLLDQWATHKGKRNSNRAAKRKIVALNSGQKIEENIEEDYEFSFAVEEQA